MAPEEILEEQIQRDTLNGPLKGQPVAVKDNFCVKGMPATCGSRMLNSFKAPYNATAVEKLTGL
jgi:aspartyl-tRNA(Asn)/glutamyl-tRNA(Gln) amidotransferase subunit A